MVDVSPRSSVSNDTGPTETIYLCKGYDGQRFWAKQNCYHRGGSTLEREVSVPRGLSWQDQVAQASGARQQAEALQHVPHTTSAPARASTDTKAHTCAGFAQALRDNDSAARVGGNAQWMEHLANTRRSVIAQQQAAGCR